MNQDAGTGVVHYLDHACFSPPAQSTEHRVLHAVQDLTSVVQHDATDLALAWLQERDRARAAVASLIQAPQEDVTLVESTTHGLGIVAAGLPLRAGDNVVVADCDFIGLPTVWRGQERQGVELRAARTHRGRLSIDSLDQVVDERTRVISVSAVQEVSGVPTDLAAVAAVAAAVGAYVVVDGIQEAGVIGRRPALDGIHAYAAGGHKWLRSPYGLGFLWTSKELRDHLVPPFQGYFALAPPGEGWPEHLTNPQSTSLDELPFRHDASRLEVGGTPNWVGAVGLAAAIGALLRDGPAQVERSARGLADALRGELLARGIEPLTEVGAASTVVTFSLGPGESDAEVVSAARRAGVRVSARGSAGVHGVRVGCHAHNTAEDIAALLDVVDDCLGARIMR